jgi:hypothetical protein
MITFLFKEFLFVFRKLVRGGMSFTNQHLLILDGHDNHVTLKAIKQAKKLRLNMITLPSHTLQTLQSLYVSCFKPFKITFKKIKNASVFRSNDMEPYKITLSRWVDQALEQSLIKKLKSEF